MYFRRSVFIALFWYLHSIVKSSLSIAGSCFATLPYLLRIGESRKEVTDGYPDPISSKTADDLPPRSRGLLFNDIERCTGCGDCEHVCPAGCIEVASEPGAHDSRIWVSVFDVDFSRCVFCGLCVDICQPMSLVHTRQYEGAAYQLEDLVASFGRGQVTEEQREKWHLARQRLSAPQEGA